MKIRLTPPRLAIASLLFAIYGINNCTNAFAGPPAIGYAWTSTTPMYPTPIDVGNDPYTVQANATIDNGMEIGAVSIQSLTEYPTGSPYLSPLNWTYVFFEPRVVAWHIFNVVNQATGTYSVLWSANASPNGAGMIIQNMMGPNQPAIAGPYNTP